MPNSYHRRIVNIQGHEVGEGLPGIVVGPRLIASKTRASPARWHCWQICSCFSFVAFLGFVVARARWRAAHRCDMPGAFRDTLRNHLQRVDART